VARAVPAPFNGNGLAKEDRPVFADEGAGTVCLELIAFRCLELRTKLYD